MCSQVCIDIQGDAYRIVGDRRQRGGGDKTTQIPRYVRTVLKQTANGRPQAMLAVVCLKASQLLHPILYCYPVCCISELHFEVLGGLYGHCNRMGYL